MKMIRIFSICIVLFMSCSKSEKEKISTQEEDTMLLKEGENVSRETRNKTNWDEVDVTSPIVRYEEVKSEEIEVRGTDSYSVYSMDEKILFDFDKAKIRDTGKEKLEEVINSVEKRHPDGEVAVRGYADAIGSEDYNKQLAEERAEAVAQYIQKNTDIIEEDEITILAKGEQDPVASNETEKGRQKNRRVEILVRN
jgi:outer membrane protein OmpA-like peptidoglycan-associated protein